jgi:hypothetical protein
MDDAEESRHVIDGQGTAAQRHRQVEAESIDVHLGHPIAQAVHD